MEEYPSPPNNVIWYTTTNHQSLNLDYYGSFKDINGNTVSVIEDSYDTDTDSGTIRFDGEIYGISYFLSNIPSEYVSSITFPKSIKKFEMDGCNNCPSLKSVTLPKDAEVNGYNWFYNCGFNANEQGLIMIDGYVFHGNDNHYEQTKLNFPENAVSIQPDLIWASSSYSYEYPLWEEIYIPKNVKYLGENILDIEWDFTIPVTSINVDSQNQYYYSENNCLVRRRDKKLLATVYNEEGTVIPNGVEIIASGCELLPTNGVLSFPSGVKEIGTNIGGYNLADMELTTVIIPDSVEHLSERLFGGHLFPTLTSVTISSNLKEIPYNNGLGILSFGFYQQGMYNLPIENGMQYAGTSSNNVYMGIVFTENREDKYRVKEGTKYLDNGWLNGSLFFDKGYFNYIDDYDFQVELPSTLVHIGGDKEGYGGIKYIEIPENVETINSWAFNGLITEVVIMRPTTPPILGENAFGEYDNRNLTIYVPQTSFEEYRTSPIWEHYEEFLVEY